MWCAVVLLVAAAAIPTLLVSAAVVPLLPQPVRPPVRLFVFSVAFLAIYECGALIGCCWLWIASSLGRRLTEPPFRRAHGRLHRRLLSTLFGVALPAVRLRLTVASVAVPDDRPLLVLSRHVGAFNVALVAHLVAAHLGREPVMIVKQAVGLDPGLRVLLRRLSFGFIQPGVNGRASALAAITEVCRSARPGDAVILFPEGTSFTPARRARALHCLQRNGLHWQAAWAHTMRHVLPPHLTGALAALTAMPEADVVFLAHTGVVTIPSPNPADWRHLAADDTIRATCWWVPGTAVPGDPDTRAAWLIDHWRHLDTWAADQGTTASADQLLRDVESGPSRSTHG
jgi:1-acyl-sn-glycerol-3-phosphate acyltransferase